MRDTRYCEIFTVFLSPSPTAKVNNSNGLNNCRQGWWESLDTTALADQSGADLVLLNGLRYWLMDKVVVSDPGPSRASPASSCARSRRSTSRRSAWRRRPPTRR